MSAVAATRAIDVHVTRSEKGELSSIPIVYNIRLKEGATPVIHAARWVPMMIRAPLKEELDRMEGLKVIHEVEAPTQWVLGMFRSQRDTCTAGTE